MLSQLMISHDIYGGFEGLESFSDLGDYASAANDLFAALGRAGVSGDALRNALAVFTGIAQSASSYVKDPFMYEINSRPELQTSAPVPKWLIDQIGTRLKAMLVEVNDSARKDAEGMLVALKKSLPGMGITGSTPPAAMAAPKVSKAGVKVDAGPVLMPGAPHKSSFWSDYGLAVGIAGAGVVAAVALALLDRKKARPAMAGLGRLHRHRARRRR